MTKNLPSKRILLNFERFKNALKTLKTAVEDSSHNQYLQDATIQRFEYTYERVMKVMKYILEDKGVVVTFVSDVFSQAFQAGWLSNGEVGNEMILARNGTSHEYNEKNSEKVYNEIITTYYKELEYIKVQLEGVINGYTKNITQQDS